MFINPKVAIEKGWIKGIKDPAKQVQPNAIDFTLDKVFWQDQRPARVSEVGKTMRDLIEMPVSDAGFWTLAEQRVFDGTSDVYVDVPEGVAAILYTRSTFARNGVFIMSGLYDTGYKGNIGFTIYTPGGAIDIAPGTRIGQIAFIAAQNAGAYAGGYNHEAGQHWTQRESSVPTPDAPGANLPRFLEQTHKIPADHGEGDSMQAGTKTFV